MNYSLASAFAADDLLIYLAFALLAASYLMTSMFWLRALAVAGLVAAMAQFYLSGDDSANTFGWYALLILVNVAQLAWLIRERLSLRLSAKDAPLLREALPNLNDIEIAKLLRAADWQNFAPGDVLTRQDVPVDALYFLCTGRANVEVNRSLVTYLERGSFVGEIAYLTGNPATATVTIEEPSRVLKFSKMRMAKVVAADEHINSIIYQLLGRDLAMKMRRSNTRRVLVDEDESIKT